MAGHVVNRSTKFEDPMAIRSWVMSSDISHRIPLTMRLQQLRMRRITWPMRKGNFTHIFDIPDPDLPIHYTTFMALRWRLRAVYSSPMIKLFLGWKFLSTKSALKLTFFWEKGGVNIKFWFYDPEKAHRCPKLRLVFWLILRQNSLRRLGCTWFPETQKIAE